MRAAQIIEDQQPLLFAEHRATRHRSRESLLNELASFRQFRTATQVMSLGHGGDAVPVFVNEFWTSKQRVASSLHEISYRACYKPQLPRFFVERLTGAADTIYDPFLGRGTTMIEAALLGRSVVGCDINPLSSILTAPRLRPPSVRQVRERLATVNWNYDGDFNEELLTFYHPDTLREIHGLQSHLLRLNRKHVNSELDD